jgi:hypothetical protein
MLDAEQSRRCGHVGINPSNSGLGTPGILPRSWFALCQHRATNEASYQAQGSGSSGQGGRQCHRPAEKESGAIDERWTHQAHQSPAGATCDAESEEKGEGIAMKHQVIALLEALQLVKLQGENFKRRRQRHDQTRDKIAGILGDPKVASALRSVEHITDAPSIVPDKPEVVA